MQTSSHTPYRSNTQAANAFDAVAWRASGEHSRSVTASASDEEIELPRWAIIAGGGVLAALMGAMVGGGLAL
ncbi:hypothetical protein [Brevundimonas sp.]|uniref:hypothetical protein n=1 Tax=Brevundimonas sp. TaxID=1871086 RepID=UPI002ABBDF4D|nr:hypothetical protein [Brevundimonas sp.]MDZ4362954.1 hypothetical protein [Brevundimonas sp.]